MKKQAIHPRSLPSQVELLNKIVPRLKKANTIKEKLLLLDKFFHFNIPNNSLLDKGKKELVYKSLSIIGQVDHLFHGVNHKEEKSKIDELIENLFEIEQFYAPIGGIIGYHHELLKLLTANSNKLKAKVKYEKPEGIDLSQKSAEVNAAVRYGIEHFEDIAEVYPVAGAGDRLNLLDEITKEALPAAELKFLGISLLEGLIRDLQGREYLFYKLSGKQAKTPIALMTSLEKNNDQHIRSILAGNAWFNRPKNRFFFMLQRGAPLITKEGLWAISTPLKPILKPGGHGVIWKLASDSGAIDWLKKLSREKALVRQINNPIAGVDLGLLALTGIGCHYNKVFGFASCPRALNTAEGMDVLIEKKTEKGFEYSITNLEYTEFEKLGIKDIPASPQNPYSLYPSNTNILFVNLQAINKLIKKMPIPGMLLNMKSKSHCLDAERKLSHLEVGRLESTMQNIADIIITHSSKRLNASERKHKLKTFITYNLRSKTISVTKKLLSKETALHETPEGAFYDLLLNAHELFQNHLNFKLPPMVNEKEYLAKGPNFIIRYHPALGPLYSVISQKIRNGVLSERCELTLEIAELEVENLNLEGSLQIIALQPMGHLKNKLLNYSQNCGKCTLKNVTVTNQGMDYSKSAPFWKYSFERKESLEILIEGNGEFYAENVQFKGGLRIVVPNQSRIVASMKKGRLIFTEEKLTKPTWFWSYSFARDNSILVKKGK